MLIVQKFGGSSVANRERVMRVAGIIAETYSEGNQVVVAVSAQGDTTDELIEKAYEINDHPSRREMDMLLASGEQISVALLAMAIEKLGLPVVSLTGWQAGVQTDGAYGLARIQTVRAERISQELDQKKIVIVAGFQGINQRQDITTLGRGGSDTTAVALAAALHADRCQIYTDVDGVYTADPRYVEGTRKINEITYDEMLELASLGANVLHNRSVEMAKKYGVELEVCSSFRRVPGTIVKEVTKVEKMLITGVARDNNVARIAVLDLESRPGAEFKIFSLLAKKNINVDIILQSAPVDGKHDLSFTVCRDVKDQVMKLLRDNLESIQAREITCNDSISKVSVVGAGMANNPGVASKMFEALSDANITIHLISTSEIKISVLVAEEDSDRAMRAVHSKFFPD